MVGTPAYIVPEVLSRKEYDGKCLVNLLLKLVEEINQLLRHLIQIWDGVPKPEEHKDTPLSEFQPHWTLAVQRVCASVASIEL